MKLFAVAVASLMIGVAVGGLGGWKLTDKSHTVDRLSTANAGLKLQVAQSEKISSTQRSALRKTKRALRRANADRMEPGCPPPVYGADGTMGPILCQAVNPLAVAYYKKIYPGLFTLGPNASPASVDSVLSASPTTLPIECAAYTLAKQINQWTFGIDPVQYCDA